MNDDRLRRLLQRVEEPLPPSADYAATLLGDLRAELGHRSSAAGRVERVVGGRPRGRRRPNAAWLLAAALALLAIVGVLVATGALRIERPLPAVVDVPFHRVDLAGSLVMPGPGPAAKPVELWRAPLGQTTFSPIVVDGQVIVGASNAGRLLALDARTGSERWHFDVGVAGTSFRGSAAAAGGMVYVADEATLYALDAATGVKRWSAAAPTSESRPKVADGVVYQITNEGAAGFDASTGARVWTWVGPDGGGRTLGAIGDEVALIGAADGRLRAIDLRDSHEHWAVQTISATVGSSEIVGDTVYVVTNQNQATDPVGELYAIDRVTGAIRWRFRGPSGLQLTVGPSIGGVLYINGEADGIYALRDDGSSFTQVWHRDAPRSYFPMSIVGDTLYEQRHDGSVGAYASADGSLIWETPRLDANGGGPPVVTGGMVFVVNEQKGILAFGDALLAERLPSSSLASSRTPPASTPVEAIPNPFSIARVTPWAVTGLATPVGMAPGPDGMLYVLDTKPSVTVLDPRDGRVVQTWGRQGSGPGELDLTRIDDNPGYGDIAVATDGRVYVADGTNRRVQVFSPQGRFLFSFGRAGTEEALLDRIAEIALGPEGSVYVLDLAKRPLSKFTADGSFVWRGPPVDTGTPTPGSIGVRSDGVIVATAADSGKFFRFDPSDGHAIGSFAPEQLGRGDGWGLIQLDPSDRLYIQLFAPTPEVPGAMAILAFSPDGAFIGGAYRTPAPLGVAGNHELAYGDWYIPTPVFLSEGRAFTFSAEGLVEMRVQIP